MASNERKVPISQSNQSYLDLELNSIRDRFEFEMNKMEQEILKFRAQLSEAEKDRLTLIHQQQMLQQQQQQQQQSSSSSLSSTSQTTTNNNNSNNNNSSSNTMQRAQQLESETLMSPTSATSTTTSFVEQLPGGTGRSSATTTERRTTTTTTRTVKSAGSTAGETATDINSMQDQQQQQQQQIRSDSRSGSITRADSLLNSSNISSSSNNQQTSVSTSTRNWLDGLQSPLIQDCEEGKVLKLRFDVTQYEPEEIQVKTIDNKLQVHARHEEKSENRSVYREYNREFHLPEGTDPELIKSSLSRDGVLTVDCPLPTAQLGAASRRIPIDKI